MAEPNRLKLLGESTSGVSDEDLWRQRQANGIKIRVDFLGWETISPPELAAVLAKKRLSALA
ncbi:unnamed protein product [Brassica rapa]|uniref:Uncharacterized protein n=2 Tax=Brassica TaxID=3705 RepID=A0A3P5ZF72_BRACM|nr:unnamed protein product [Brassica napus]CAG7876273.1 unnamed protein product [Brassica rapa]CDY47996.1 BnaA05g36330D [Brassica napus]VDC71470.1 unnamed protein product [Brassica rapa]